MTQGLPHGTRMVVRSGTPTDDEALAVLFALDVAARADQAAAAAARPTTAPAWRRAARQESVGGRAAASPSDLEGWGRAG
jgi:hypothetical protein